LAAAAAGVRAQSPAQDGQPPAPAASESRRRTGDRQLIRALNLTPEQRAEIARIRLETRQQNRLIGQRIRHARRVLEEAIYSPAVDEQAVEERAREVAAGETARVRLRAQTELRIRRLLTPEQLDVFRELRRRAAERGRPNLRPGVPPRGRAPVPADAPGGRQPQGQPPPAARPEDPAAGQTLTPRERRRAVRARRPPLPRPLP
jgi:Spy/CpxP family protein refolding chaperone